MRLTALGVMVALGAIACGEKKADQAQAAQTSTAQTTATPPPAAPTGGGPGVEVKMTANGTNRAPFVPKTPHTAPGPPLRFTTVSGGPPNIAFYPDPVPPGAGPAGKNR